MRYLSPVVRRWGWSLLTSFVALAACGGDDDDAAGGGRAGRGTGGAAGTSAARSGASGAAAEAGASDGGAGDGGATSGLGGEEDAGGTGGRAAGRGGGGDTGETGGTGESGAGEAGGGAAPMNARFTVTVAPSTISLPRGASAWLSVHIDREAGFDAPVSITIDDLPAGLTAETLTLPASVEDGILPIFSSEELAEGSELVLELAGTEPAGAQRATASLELDVSAPQLSAQATIREALRDGALDYETSLLYRAYAFVGDARLPAAYVGAGSEEEDNGLFEELRSRIDTLSTDAQSALRPFLVRPTASESLWNGPSAARHARGSSQGPQAFRAELAAPAPATCPAQSGSAGAWISRLSTAEQVRVWAQCRGELAADVETERLVEKTLAVLRKIHAPMTSLMTVPISDVEGGDPAIDFYIVDPGVSVVRRGASFAPGGLGSTFSDNPEIDRGSSAFVLLPRFLLYTSRFHTTVIHEFFHVLQKAYNQQYAYQESATPDVYSAHWFPEASAVWAAAHFDRLLAPWPDGRAAYLDAHLRFTQRFQNSQQALNAPEPVPHTYAAYIWPYFVEQERESPDFMAQMWEGISGASTFEQADDAIDAVFPFRDHFKDFALRNLNSSYTPGDPLPEARRYVALDSHFPDRHTPTYTEGTLEPEQAFELALPLENLAARYVFLRVSSPIKKATFEFGGLTPADQIDVQALVHTGEGWVSEPLDFSDEDEVVFCFDKGRTTVERRGSFDAMLLVISNHAVRADSRTSGELVVEPTESPCTPVWQGTISATHQQSVELGTVTWSSTTPVVFEFDDTAPVLPFSTPYRLRSGSYTYEWLGDYTNRTPTCRTRESASGTMIPETVPSGTPGHSVGSLRIESFFEPVTYTGSGFAIGIGELTSNCNDSNIESTSEYFPAFTWWAMDYVAQQVSEDGNTIEGTYDAAEGTEAQVHYAWQLTRVDE
jgi:hypothetical protein